MARLLVLLTILLSLNSCHHRQAAVSSQQATALARLAAAAIDTTIWRVSLKDTFSPALFPPRLSPSFPYAAETFVPYAAETFVPYAALSQQPSLPIIRHASIEAQRVSHTTAASLAAAESQLSKQSSSVATHPLWVEATIIIVLFITFAIMVFMLFRFHGQ